MKQKRKAFTLIELLAVIIVLAIIALIAMPIIFNVIENAKLKSLENSAYGVVDAVRLQYMENLMNSEDGTVTIKGNVTDLTLSGEHPTGGTWEIVNDANAEDGGGIKITDVTYASMQGYVCNSEEVDGKLTGKVICSKQEPGIVFEFPDGVINDKGWAKEPFDVTITAPGESCMKVCWSFEGECDTTIPEGSNTITEKLYSYNTNETKCISFAQEYGLSLEEATEMCNTPKFVELAESAGIIDAETLEAEGVITDYKKIGEVTSVWGPNLATLDDDILKVVFDMDVNTYTFDVLNINDLSIPLIREGNTYVCVETEGKESVCEVLKLDTRTPSITAITTTPIVGKGFNSDNRKFFDGNLYLGYRGVEVFGPSNGNVLCKDASNNEFTNTQDLAVGTYAVTCTAISNNGLNSNDVALTITVEEKELIRLETDTNGNGAADLGDEVCIEEECFYVLTNDGTNIRMLSKYRIDASDNTTRKDRLQNTGRLNTGFSNDSVKGINYNSYEGSIVEDLVQDYKKTLERIGVMISEATLLSYDEITAAPFNCQYNNSSCNPTYSWLYKDGNTTSYAYWTRSAMNDTTAVYSFNGSYIGFSRYPYPIGVRPVITIATSALN